MLLLLWVQMNASELKQKYCIESDNIHDPNPNCRFCNGPGEKVIKRGRRKDELIFCVCIFVHHSLSNMAGEMLSEFAKSKLAEIESRHPDQ